MIKAIQNTDFYQHNFEFPMTVKIVHNLDKFQLFNLHYTDYM